MQTMFKSCSVFYEYTFKYKKNIYKFNDNEMKLYKIAVFLIFMKGLAINSNNQTFSFTSTPKYLKLKVKM